MKGCCLIRTKSLVPHFLLILLFAAAAHSQTFTVSAAPSSITILPGQQNVPVTITIGNSTYSGPITVTLAGTPTGISAAPIDRKSVV